MTVLGTILATIAANVASQAISRKISPEKEQKRAIPAGTATSISPGPIMEIAPVEGSEVQDFGEFTVDDMAEPESSGEAEYILQTLAEAGIDPNTLNEHGIVGMYLGGYLSRANGGGLLSLLSKKGEDEDTVDFLRKHGIIAGDQPQIHQIDFSETEPPKPEDLFEESMIRAEAQATPTPSLFDDPELVRPSTMLEKANTGLERAQNWIDSQDPMVSAAIYKGLGSIGSSIFNRLFGDDEEPKGSMVKTKTLPAGNSNRRRAALEITPIGGSSVSFADGGSVLKRPMFMPSGGAMYGPGGSKDDLIPVMASNGEYMLSKAAVDAAGDGSHAQGLARLDAFNKMGNMRYG